MQFLIDTIRQFIHVTNDEAELLRQLFTEKHLAKGEHFLTAGQVCRSVAVIRSGLLRYYIHDDGEERTYYFSKEGEFCCDYESFLPQAAANKNIEALEDTTLYLISHNHLQRLYRDVKEGERLGRLGIEQVFVSVLRQLSSLYKDPPEVRYLQFLETFAAISQRVPQYYIASYVGVKPQSLSRIRKRISRPH